MPTVLDNFARAKLIVHTTLLHARETAEVDRAAPPVELALVEVDCLDDKRAPPKRGPLSLTRCLVAG